MRGAVSCFLLSTLPALAAGVNASGVTVVLDFEVKNSSRALQIMEREAESVLKDSRLRFDWIMRDEAVGKTFPNLVIVRFKGDCSLQAAKPVQGELGTLAFTYISDGVVQPFSDVACDKVGAFVLSSPKTGANKDPDQMMGVALGRVVAHELVHMVLGSDSHAKGGVFKPGLTVQQLVTGELPLDDDDSDRLRVGH
jgi:hypothetical protein